jgi:DNA uptake protein ComE-like DNA-binding protein
MKKFIEDYFTFTKKERIAAMIVVIIIVIFLMLPYIFTGKQQKKLLDADTNQKINQFRQAIDSAEKYRPKKFVENTNNQFKNEENAVTTSASLFYFDPNTIDISGWMRLGISEKTATTILKYVSKGGKFRNPDDIRKIWSLRKNDADRIIPFVRIENNYTAAKFNGSNAYKAPTEKTVGLLNANTASSYDLKKLPGIGNSLPYKIVNFREKLGGFLNMQQVKETYGMTDSIFQSILPLVHVLPITIKKLNINSASDFELNAHPYIDKRLSKAITIYRSQHGNYKSVNELKNIVFITDEVLQKITPYLTID